MRKWKNIRKTYGEAYGKTYDGREQHTESIRKNVQEMEGISEETDFIRKLGDEKNKYVEKR